MNEQLKSIDRWVAAVEWAAAKKGEMEASLRPLLAVAGHPEPFVEISTLQRIELPGGIMINLTWLDSAGTHGDQVFIPQSVLAAADPVAEFRKLHDRPAVSRAAAIRMQMARLSNELAALEGEGA